MPVLKSILKQVLPNGICEYSVRRNAFLRMGLGNGEASLVALGSQPYQAIREARLDLLPTQITADLHTCVDAGAHEGSWTSAVLRIFHPKRILLIECEPRLVGLLKTRFGNRPETQVLDAALSAEDGLAQFYQLRHPAGSSLLRPRDEIRQEFVRNSWDVVGCAQVTTVSYDRLVESYKEVSVLKLDIQGSETKVLRNSISGLKKTKSILIEVPFLSHYEDDSTFPELHALMKHKGFGLYRLSDTYHRGGRALFADAVYVQEEMLQELSRALQ